MLIDEFGEPRPVERFTYVRNPSCDCAWCRNGGQNPRPNGYFAALGYDIPHVPAPGPRLVHLDVPGSGPVDPRDPIVCHDYGLKYGS